MNVDVVVVTYNSAKELPELFEALGGAAPVTVVDNASTDDSADVAEAHGAKVVRGTVNAGFGAGCNRGAKLGSADYLLFLNPDARIERPDLEQLVAAFDRNPDFAIGSPQLSLADGRPQRVVWPFPTARDGWAEALGVERLFPNHRADFVVGACLFVRRSAFEAVGGFDERIWLYGEETDLCRRLRDAGGTVAVVSESLATHIGGASGDTVRGLVREHFTRGGEHFISKYQGRGALVSYRLAMLVGSAVRGGLGVGARVELHRWRFRRTAQVLRHHPTSVALDSPATAAPGTSLVVCSLERWDEVWRRNQFLIRELLALDPDLRILFVEPAFDLLHERHRGAGRRHERGLRPVETDGRITRVEPLKLLPRRLGPLADRLRDRQVARAVDRLGFTEPTVWVNDPTYASLAASVRWPALYDITDDWTQVGIGRADATAAANERRLFARCETVVVCSAGLAESRQSARPDLVVVPNAADVDHLRRPRSRPADLPEGDTAVYVGTLHSKRIDVTAVVDLARSLPHLTVVLIGPDQLAASDRERLAACANVCLTGPRAYADVPAYLQHASVVIVPHLVSSFTDSLDPIKLYECLALGRVTVATPVAGFRDAGPPVRIADAAAFAATVEAVLAEHPADRPQAVPSWADRAAAFDQALRSARCGAQQAPLRVVYLDHCARLSGGELALARLLPALEHVEPFVILGEHGPLEALLHERHIPTEVLALDERVANTNRAAVTPAAVGLRRIIATARDVRTLAARLRELQPDLVHTNSLKMALLGGVAGRLARIPVLWHVRDRIAEDYLPRPAVRLVRAAARVLPSAIIANSASTRSTLGRGRGADVIASPVVYDLVESAPHRTRSDHDRPFCVTMVGRLSPWKGQDVFLDAFARAFPHDDTQAVIAGTAMFGEDAYADELLAQVRRLGIADRVHFAGFVDDVHELLADSDLLVHASVIPEPFGQVVLEGLAAGVPVLASDLGGPAEIITDGIDGILCPPGDVQALARTLHRLAGDPAERDRLATAGLLRAADFRPEVIAEQVERSYENLLRSRSRKVRPALRRRT